MSANKNGKQAKKASVKRMHRPEKMEAIARGQFKIHAFFARAGLVVGA